MATTITQLNQNTVEIIGTLVEADVKDDMSKTGKKYASAKYVVKSIINNVENLFEIKSMSMATTSKGDSSKKYENILASREWIGKKVNFRGSIKENRFWSAKQSKVASVQDLDGSLFLAKNDAEDTATFRVGGYVRKELAEIQDKEGVPYIYRIEIGQYDYDKGTTKHLNVVTLDVSINEKDKAETMMQYYGKGATISLDGILTSITVERKVQEENLFGGVNERIFKDKRKSFYIVHGKEPLSEENGAAYTSALLKELEGNYAAAGVEIQNAASDNVASGNSTTAPSVNKKPTNKTVVNW